MNICSRQALPCREGSVCQGPEAAELPDPGAAGEEAGGGKGGEQVGEQNLVTLGVEKKAKDLWVERKGFRRV